MELRAFLLTARSRLVFTRELTLLASYFLALERGIFQSAGTRYSPANERGVLTAHTSVLLPRIRGISFSDKVSHVPRTRAREKKNLLHAPFRVFATLYGAFVCPTLLTAHSRLVFTRELAFLASYFLALERGIFQSAGTRYSPANESGVLTTHTSVLLPRIRGISFSDKASHVPRTRARERKKSLARPPQRALAT